MSLLKIININDPGTGFRFGGDDLDEVNRILSGEDRGKLIKFENIVYFGGAQKFRVLRPNGTNWVSFNSEAETANRAILVPLLGADQRMVFEALSQPLSNKQINFANNTPTNFPGAAINNASVDGAKLIDASVNGGKLIDNTVLDAKINGVAFAKITGQIAMSQITDNTITNAKLVQITDVSKIQDGLITSAKIADGTIVDGDVSASASIGAAKLKDVDKDVTLQKVGRWETVSRWKLDVWGFLKDMKYVGSFAAAYDGSGSGQSFSTGTGGANSWAGTYIIETVGAFAAWARAQNLSMMKIKSALPARTSGDMRFLYGYYTGITFPPAADGHPMDVNNGGVMVGFDSDDTNFQIYVGSGDGVTAPTAAIDTGLAVPATATLYIFVIEWTATASVTVSILNGSTLANMITPVVITSNLPASTKSLNFVNLINNPTNANKLLSCYGGYGRTLK